MGIMCMQHVLSSDFKGSDLELGVVEAGQRFRMVGEDEIETHLTAISEQDMWVVQSIRQGLTKQRLRAEVKPQMGTTASYKPRQPAVQWPYRQGRRTDLPPVWFWLWLFLLACCGCASYLCPAPQRQPWRQRRQRRAFRVRYRRS